MALTVATNTGALMAQAAASSVNREMETSMERLSTGKRINSASDDAAGVAIASRLSAEIKGTNQAIRNAMDAQAMIDTAEGAHKEVENLLQRMREVAVQAANDTNSSDDRVALQAEMTQLTNEINRIAATTTWAGVYMLNGNGNDGVISTTADHKNTFNFQISSNETGTNDSLAVGIKAVDATSLGVGGSASAATVSFGTLTEADTTANVSNTATGVITIVKNTGATTAADQESFTFTVDGGSTLEFDFHTDGTAKGYDSTSATSLGLAFEQFLEDNLDTNQYSFSVSTGSVTINKKNSVNVSSNTYAQAAMTSIDSAILELNI